MPKVQDRRTRIADAVIAVLAERGSRGLTHRAVDEVAGLPAGSTSYYVRTRAQLLASAVPRLAELDAASLGSTRDSRQSLIDAMHDAVHGPGRQRTIARYELVLEAARRPEIRQALNEGTEMLLSGLIRMFSSSPAEEAHIKAMDVMAFLDGMLLANVTAPEAERQSRAELAAALDRIIGGEL